MPIYLVVCGSVLVGSFRERAEADALAMSWQRAGATARVVTVMAG